MLFNILVFILILFITFQYVKNPFIGVLLFIGVVFFCPYVIIGSLGFRIEMLLVPLLFLITLIRKGSRFIVSPIFIAWILFVVYIFCVSFINSAPNLESNINMVAFYNFLRYGALLLIGANLNATSDDIQKFNKIIFYCSIPIALLAIGLVLGNGVASSITEYYTSPTRSVFTTQLSNIDKGFLFRSIGVFENVSYYSSFILVILTLGITFILNQYENLNPSEKWLVALTMILNMIAGISASSLTFYAGFGILLAFLWIKRPIVTTKIFLVSFIVIYISIVFFFKNLLSANQQYLDSFTYLYQGLIGGDKISERYSLTSRENGDLGTLLGHSWIQGNGFRVFDKIIVNDSLYLEFLYEGGIIGVILLALFLGTVLFYIFKSSTIRSKRIYLILAVLLISGLGCNTLSIVRMSEWFWLMLGIISVNSHVKKESHMVIR